jgi:hypothetical protein
MLWPRGWERVRLVAQSWLCVGVTAAGCRHSARAALLPLRADPLSRYHKLTLTLLKASWRRAQQLVASRADAIRKVARDLLAADDEQLTGPDLVKTIEVGQTHTAAMMNSTADVSCHDSREDRPFKHKAFHGLMPGGKLLAFHLAMMAALTHPIWCSLHVLSRPLPSACVPTHLFLNFVAAGYSRKSH